MTVCSTIKYTFHYVKHAKYDYITCYCAVIIIGALARLHCTRVCLSGQSRSQAPTLRNTNTEIMQADTWRAWYFFSCDHDVIKIGPEPCLQTLSGGVAVPVCAKNPACSAFTTTHYLMVQSSSLVYIWRRGSSGLCKEPCM